MEPKSKSTLKMPTFRDMKYGLPLSARHYIRNKFPDLWKLSLEEIEHFEKCKATNLFIQESNSFLKYVALPVLINLGCVTFRIIPFAPTWLSVIFMVHWMTKNMHDQEFHESIASPKFWVRFLTDLFLGVVCFSLRRMTNAEDLAQTEVNKMDMAEHVSVVIFQLTSSFSTAGGDFCFYRMYLSLMKAFAVTHRIIYPLSQDEDVKLESTINKETSRGENETTKED